MSDTDYIALFCGYLLTQKGYSKNTVISYRNDLSELQNYLSEVYNQHDLTKVSPQLLRSWLSSLKETKMEARSINRKLSAVKSFFKFLLRKEMVSKSPADSLHSLKTGKKLPVFVEEEKMQPILHRSFYPDGFDGDTRLLIISFLYLTGARVSELALLKERDVQFSAAMAVIRGKGNKQRNIPLSPGLLAIISDYRTAKRRLFEKPSEILVVNSKNKPLSRVTIYKIVKNTLSEVTTIAYKGPHVLRHSFATHLSNHGAGIGAIKDLLGHASLAATQVYTHTSIARLKEIYDKAHPKS